MSEYVQILQMDLVISTVAINLGLILTVLIVRAITQIRTNQIMDRILILENRILSQMQRTSVEVEMEGTPVILEDLIKRDLMEQMGNNLMTPATEKELKGLLQEIQEKKKS